MSRQLALRVERLEALLGLALAKSAPGSISSSAGNFVWREGGVAGPGIYTSWATLGPALEALDPDLEKVVSVDNSLAPAHVTPRATPWNVENTRFVSAGSAVSTIIFDDGAHWAWHHLTFDLIEVQHNGATPVTSLTSPGILTLLRAAQLTIGTGTAAIVSVGATAFELLALQSTIGQATIAATDPAAIIAMSLNVQSVLAANAVTMAAGGTLGVQFDGSSTVMTAQTPLPALTAVEPPTCFTWSPSSSDGPSTFTTWERLGLIYEVCPGKKQIIMDDPLAGTITPRPAAAGGGAWTLGTCVMTTRWNGSAQIDVADGATLDFSTLEVLAGLTLNSNSATPVFMLGAAGAFALVTVKDSASLISSTAAPFLVADTGATLEIHVFNHGAFGDGAHPVVQTNATAAAPTGLFVGSQGIMAANAITGAGTTSLVWDQSADINLTQGPGTFFAFRSAPNLATGQNTGGPLGAAGTIVQATGNLSRRRSGRVDVKCNMSGTASGATTVTVNVLRDAGVLFSIPVVTTGGTNAWQATPTFVDTLPDLAAHTYSVQAVAGAGTVTTPQNGAYVSAIELP